MPVENDASQTSGEQRQEAVVVNGTKSPPSGADSAQDASKEHKKTDSNACSFLRAARSGNLEKLLEFLKTNTDINTCNANGLNALHLASKEGYAHIVKELLVRGANVEAATKKGNTALHIASLAGQEEIVEILVEHNASVNIQSTNGFTPLYMAAQENHDKVVRFLLAHGANQSLATEDGFTPLAVALQQGHDKVVAVLLENDTRGKVRLPALHIAAKKDDTKAAALLLHTDHNPDVTSKSGFTPLHIAAHYGNENIAALLVQRGADVNYVAKHQITPLHVASKWGKANMVSLLLEKGGSIESRTRDGLTPLHCAARSGHEAVVDLLLEKGAPITAKTKNGLAPLHMASQGDHVDAARILLYHKAPVDDVTVDYLTALHVAAHCGHVRVAKLLLDRKADPNSRALNGFTPMHIACKKNRIKVVELLLKHGASIEATTESGLTPLHVASFMGCMNIVIYLLQHGAAADVPTVRGETPLHLAARANQTDIIRILIRNGANVDARAREQQTALHIASRLGNSDIVVLLLQHGASVDATTKDNYTALHIAAKEGQEEVASILLDHGASLAATTKKGFTPLHLAAKYGNMKVARLLLQKDAIVDAQGKNGITPLHVAAHYDHQNVALLLLDKGASPQATAKNGYTPLHIAARKNQMDIATTLLEYGANVNCESKAGFTPLHLSSQEGHTDMSTLLIEHSATPSATAKNGLTPLHLCAQEDRVNVAAILVKHGSQIDPRTKAGYTPLHVACHFGQINMVRFLLQHSAEVEAATQLGYTPLHQAAQQGHTLIVNLLLENKAEPNAETKDGKTALNIAQRLGYISVVETLKVITETTITTTTTTTTEEKYKVVVPETMHETFMSESEDEGGDDTMLGDQSYRYLTVDEMKSLGDDSLPIDVTKDEKMDTSFTGAPPQAPVDQLSPQHVKEQYAQYTGNYAPDNVDISRAPVLAGHQSFQSLESATDYSFVSTDDDSRTQPAATAAKWRVLKRFLVSFMVDARGGAMRGCRHSGVRVIIPPRKAAMPMRITCRYLKKDKLVHAPPLMEGEALASRILEMGPASAKFLGPVIIEVPHFAALREKEREIVILRSDNGETWREHTLEATEEAVQEVLNESFDGDELKQLEDLNTNRITRILTTDFPQYFAIVSRIRQEVHAIGPEGGMVSSTVVPQVQAVFPQGALTKKIKVGLQAQPIPSELVAKLLGNRVAVSPIVTVEPRRRKFHKPITLTIPVPQAASKGMINQYSGEAPTLRLLCSITGGTTRAQWEDVTGSTPLTFVNDCVSFTTTVSARFWLMDCSNIPEATKMATELYREAIHVPFMSKFVVFGKRHQVEEARIRVYCMTDDKEDKTLETQEQFNEVAKSRDVEVLEGKPQYLEFAGNLIPVTKSGDQLSFNFYAFRENRLPFTVRVKDQHADPVGRIAFMRQPKVGRGDPPQTPICNLNIALPENIQPEPAPSEPDLLSLEKKYSFLSISKTDTIHKADLRLSDISNMLASDWVQLAKELEISESDINLIKSQYTDNSPQQAIVMLRLWMQTAGNKATGNTLEKALSKIGRDDIVNQCIFNVEPVTDETEKAMAKAHLDHSGLEALKSKLGHVKDSALNRDTSMDVSYDEQDLMKEAESAEEEDDSQKSHPDKIHEDITKRVEDLSPTYEREERKYAGEEKIVKDEVPQKDMSKLEDVAQIPEEIAGIKEDFDILKGTEFTKDEDEKLQDDRKETSTSVIQAEEDKLKRMSQLSEGSIKEEMVAEVKHTSVDSSVYQKEDRAALLQKLGEELGILDEKLDEKFKERSKQSKEPEVLATDASEVIEEVIVAEERQEKVAPTSQIVVDTVQALQVEPSPVFQSIEQVMDEILLDDATTEELIYNATDVEAHSFDDSLSPFTETPMSIAEHSQITLSDVTQTSAEPSQMKVMPAPLLESGAEIAATSEVTVEFSKTGPSVDTVTGTTTSVIKTEIAAKPSVPQESQHVDTDVGVVFAKQYESGGRVTPSTESSGGHPHTASHSDTNIILQPLPSSSISKLASDPTETMNKDKKDEKIFSPVSNIVTGPEPPLFYLDEGQRLHSGDALQDTVKPCPEFKQPLKGLASQPSDSVGSTVVKSDSDSDSCTSDTILRKKSADQRQSVKQESDISESDFEAEHFHGLVSTYENEGFIGKEQIDLVEQSQFRVPSPFEVKRDPDTCGQFSSSEEDISTKDVKTKREVFEKEIKRQSMEVDESKLRKSGKDTDDSGGEEKAAQVPSARKDLSTEVSQAELKKSAEEPLVGIENVAESNLDETLITAAAAKDKKHIASLDKTDSTKSSTEQTESTTESSISERRDLTFSSSCEEYDPLQISEDTSEDDSSIIKKHTIEQSIVQADRTYAGTHETILRETTTRRDGTQEERVIRETKMEETKLADGSTLKTTSVTTFTTHLDCQSTDDGKCHKVQSAAESTVLPLYETGKERKTTSSSSDAALTKAKLESKTPDQQLSSPINVPEENIQEIVWEVSQEQSEAIVAETVLDLPSEAPVESVQGKKRSEQVDDVKQKMSPDEARKVALDLVEEVKQEAAKRSPLTPPGPIDEYSGGSLKVQEEKQDTKPEDEFKKLILERLGDDVDADERHLIESIAAKKSEILTRKLAGSNYQPSLEITDEDLRSSGAELSPVEHHTERLRQMTEEEDTGKGSVREPSEADESESSIIIHDTDETFTTQYDQANQMFNKTLETVGAISIKAERAIETISEEQGEFILEVEEKQLDETLVSGREHKEKTSREELTETAKKIVKEVTEKAKIVEAVRKASGDSLDECAVPVSDIKRLDEKFEQAKKERLPDDAVCDHLVIKDDTPPKVDVESESSTTESVEDSNVASGSIRSESKVILETHVREEASIRMEESSMHDEIVFRKKSHVSEFSRKSGTDIDAYSSSGESHYFTAAEGTSDSRPCSSDVEGLLSAAGTSDYDTALTSQEGSQHSSQEYQTAGSSVSSRQSLKSVDSESSGHLGSVELSSEASETLVPSALELEKDMDLLDKEIIEEDKAAVHPSVPEVSVEVGTPKSTTFSDSYVEQYEDENEDDFESVSPVPHGSSKMKRSLEMTFYPELQLANDGGAPIDMAGSVEESTYSEVSAPTVIEVEKGYKDDGLLESVTMSGSAISDSTLSCSEVKEGPEDEVKTHMDCSIATAETSVSGKTRSVTITATSVSSASPDHTTASMCTQVTSDIRRPSDDSESEHFFQKRGPIEVEYIPDSQEKDSVPWPVAVSTTTVDTVADPSVGPDREVESCETEADQEYGQMMRESEFSDLVESELQYALEDQPEAEKGELISIPEPVERPRTPEPDVVPLSRRMQMFTESPPDSEELTEVDKCFSSVFSVTFEEIEELNQTKPQVIDVPDIKITEHMGPMPLQYQYPDLEREEDFPECQALIDCQSQGSHSSATSPKSSTTDSEQGREYCLDQGNNSLYVDVSSFEVIEPNEIDDIAEYEQTMVFHEGRLKGIIEEDEEEDVVKKDNVIIPLTLTAVKIEPTNQSGCEGQSPDDLDTSNGKDYESSLEEQRRWLELQFENNEAESYSYGQASFSDHVYGGPLEDIEEEKEDVERRDLSHVIKTPSLSSTPEYDVLAGRKFFTRSTDHDDLSVSSLQEFERLEREVAIEGVSRRSDSGSQESLNGRKLLSKSGHGDDVSVGSATSLTEFERLEKECQLIEQMEQKVKEEESMLSEIEEGHESQVSESESCETISEAGKESEDGENYEDRMFEIDEIIKEAQKNVENFESDKMLQGMKLKDLIGSNDSSLLDKTPSVGHEDDERDKMFLDEASHEEKLTFDASEDASVEEGHKAVHISQDSLENISEKIQDPMTESADSLEIVTKPDMTTSTDSLEGHKKDSGMMSISTDSLEPFKRDAMTTSVDSIGRDDSSGREGDVSSGSEHVRKDAGQDETLMEWSTDSLEPSSSQATHATYQYETDSVMSSSFTSGCSNTLVGSVDEHSDTMTTSDYYAEELTVDNRCKIPGTGLESILEKSTTYSVHEHASAQDLQMVTSTAKSASEIHSKQLSKPCDGGSSVPAGKVPQLQSSVDKGQTSTETLQTDEHGNIMRIVTKTIVSTHTVEVDLDTGEPVTTTVTKEQTIPHYTVLTKTYDSYTSSDIPQRLCGPCLPPPPSLEPNTLSDSAPKRRDEQSQ